MLGCDWAGLVDAQWDSRSDILPPGVKNWFFKNNISLTWHSLISLFCYYPPLKENVTLHFNIFESPLHKDTLCQVWFKLTKWFLRRRFLKVVNVFSLCGYYLPLINAWPFIWTNLNSLYPRILCVMFGWNWPSGSGEDFQKLSIFFNFCYYLPLEKGQVLQL